jgi:hypothetical protein
MSTVFKRTIPIILTILIVLVLCVKAFTNEPNFTFWGQTFQTWSSLIVTFATFLGPIVLLIYHFPKIMKKANEPIKNQWIYSISTVSIMIIYIVVGVSLGSTSTTYQWLYNTWYGPVSGLLNAVTAFFALSAIYRSFRVRSFESLLLIGPALIILLYDAPIGVTLFPPIGPVSEYLFAYIGPAAFRGFTVAASLGSLIFCIRTALGWERGYLPSEGESRGA